MELIYVALIGLFAGLVKGTSGFGSSLVAFPLLVLFYPAEEVVVMMITFNVALNTILLFENKEFDFKSLKGISVLTVFGVSATFFGLYIIGDLDENIIKGIAFVLIILAISNTLFTFKFRLKDNVFTQAITGILSGLGNGVASIDGPPVVFYLTSIKADKKQFKRTLATYFLVLGLISIVLLISLGKYNADILMNTLYVSIFAMFGVAAGMLFSKRLDEESFKVIIVIVLTGLAIRMIL